MDLPPTPTPQSMICCHAFKYPGSNLRSFSPLPSKWKQYRTVLKVSPQTMSLYYKQHVTYVWRRKKRKRKKYSGNPEPLWTDFPVERPQRPWRETRDSFLRPSFLHKGDQWLIFKTFSSSWNYNANNLGFFYFFFTTNREIITTATDEKKAKNAKDEIDPWLCWEVDLYYELNDQWRKRFCGGGAGFKEWS